MNPDPEIRETSSPSHDLLMLADESPESVADYVGRSRCFVAQLAGRAVGQYLLLHTRPFTAEVVSIAVDPACQRRGIGTALLHHAIRTARTAGFRRLEIGTGETGTGQIALYERCGFVRCAGGWRSVRARPAPDKSPSTNVADSCAAASTATISAGTTPPRSSKTASNAATWSASAWSSGPIPPPTRPAADVRRPRSRLPRDQRRVPLRRAFRQGLRGMPFPLRLPAECTAHPAPLHPRADRL